MRDEDAQWAIAYGYTVTKKLDLTALTVLVYDWFITLNAESRNIWREQWQFSKFLFFLARYPAIINQASVVLYEFLISPYSLTCSALLTFSSFLTLVMYIVCESTLLLRTCALHRKDRKIFWSLFTLFCVLVLGAIVAIIIWSSHLQFTSPPAPNVPGCIVKTTFTEVLAIYAIIASWEITNFALAARKGYRQHKLSRLPLYMVLWYDGFQYYVYALVSSAIEVFVLVALPINFAGMGNTIARTIHAICAYRILLHARGIANDDDHSDDQQSPIRPEFSSPPISPARRTFEFPLEPLQPSSVTDSASDRLFELTGIRSASPV